MSRPASGVIGLGRMGAATVEPLRAAGYAVTVPGHRSRANAEAALYRVRAAGPLRSGMMDFLHADASEDRIELAFAADNAAKDVGYQAEMAGALGAGSKLAGGRRALLDAAVAAGWGPRMVPEPVDFFSREDKA